MDKINVNLMDQADVLIIDDEVDICQLLSLILKHHNIKSQSSNSLTEAKETLQKIKPKVIFLDNHLPDGTGIDFIDQLKEITPDSKIIMITAHSTEANKKAAFKKGAIHFIGKPFNTDDISATIRNFM